MSVILRATDVSLAARTLASILGGDLPTGGIEAIVVDDATPGRAAATAFAELGFRVLRNDVQVGCEASERRGTSAARGSHYLFVREGAELRPRELRDLLDDLARQPEVAAVGAQGAGIVAVSAEGPFTTEVHPVLLVKAEAYRAVAGAEPARTAPAAAPTPERAPEPPPGAAVEPGGTPLVSIVIPAYDKWSLTDQCLASLRQHTTGIDYEIILVDNGSVDETRLAPERHPGVRYLRNDTNLGFAVASNQGARAARGTHLLFLNNDIEARPGWLPPLLEALEASPGAAVVGAKLLFPDGTLQHGGVEVRYADPLPIYPAHIAYRQPPSASDEPLRLSAVTAACMLVRRSVFEQVGGFDESFVNGYEDMDLCFKIRERAFEILYAPKSVLVHHESQSSGRFAAAPANENLLQRRWMGRFTAFDHDRRRSRPKAQGHRSHPPVTVVLVVKDALRGIAPCLEDLADAIGGEDQIVVVDRGSRDCTMQFVDGFSLEHPGVVRAVQVEPSFGPSAAASTALKAARHDLVVVLPHLVSVAPDFLDNLQAQSLLRSGQATAIPLDGRGFVVVGERRHVADALQRSGPALFTGDAAGVAGSVAPRARS